MNLKFWTWGESEKEKRKRMTVAEIDELLTARYNALQYKIDLQNAAEAEKYFEDLYDMITLGEFEVVDQYKTIRVICKYRTPKNVVIARIIEQKLFDLGYVVVDLSKNQIWTFKLRKDVGEDARRYFVNIKRFFDDIYLCRSLGIDY